MTELMLAPLLDILLLFEHCNGLSFDGVDEGWHKVIRTVLLFQIVYKLLSHFEQVLDPLGLVLAQNSLKEIDGFKSEIMIYDII